MEMLSSYLESKMVIGSWTVEEQSSLAEKVG